MNRAQIAELIADRLRQENCSEQYQNSASAIGHFVIDDLLPHDLAHDIAAVFPHKSLKLNSTLRERKEISAQMDQHDKLIEEALFAFQEPVVLEEIARITGKRDILPDPHLYAGGISAMRKGHFLNPHLDNSHDKDRQNWRVFNLLYYVTPEWEEKDGGNLELWPDGVAGKRITVESTFNRLVVMATHDESWHSVSPIEAEKTRRCISNYYFAPRALRSSEEFHVTSFRGRPEQKFVDLLLRADAKMRGLLRKAKPAGLFDTEHRYKK